MSRISEESGVEQIVKKRFLNMYRNNMAQCQNIYGVNRWTVQYCDIKMENGMRLS